MNIPGPTFYAIIGVAVILIGLSKGGFGGAAGAAATPLLALVLPVQEVIGLMLPLLMMADVFAVAAHWRRWDTRLILLLVPASLIGITAATALLTVLPGEALRKGLGVLVLLFVAYKLLERRIQSALAYRPRAWHGILAGATAGFTSTLAHTGGPPIVVYLLLQKRQPRMFVATSALYFALVNWLKVPYYVYAGILHVAEVQRVIWVLPLVPVGVLLGRLVATRVDRAQFERLIVVLLLLTALLLLLR